MATLEDIFELLMLEYAGLPDIDYNDRVVTIQAFVTGFQVKHNTYDDYEQNKWVLSYWNHIYVTLLNTHIYSQDLGRWLRIDQS